MPICTFFGHRDCPSSVREKLRGVLEQLITDYGVDVFYVGNQGRFDAIVRSVLQELSGRYPGIRYAVVLAYLPVKQNGKDLSSETMVPEGIEFVHPRYAISWRNQWLLQQSDYIVAYITHSWGGAYQFVKTAMKKSKIVINIGDSLII